MLIRTIAVSALLAGLSACADFPDLDRAIPDAELDGPYPQLVPTQTLLARTADPQITDEDEAALNARAAALRARADRLRRY